MKIKAFYLSAVAAIEAQQGKVVKL